MNDFAGFQPQVGEILAVRTFRIGPNGQLFPLFNDRAWSNRMNTALCSLADAHSRSHVPPEPECTCGFYGYGKQYDASEYPHATHVLAVVACWGRVIAGTRGIRAQHARLEAIWMSRRVPADLADQVADRYNGASVYLDREQMLQQHAPTALDCYYAHGGPADGTVPTGARVALVGAVLLNLVPTPWLGHSFLTVGSWALQISLLVLSAILNAGGPAGRGAKRWWVLLVAAAFWLLAPTGGVAGWLLIRGSLLDIAIMIVLVRRHQAADSRRFPATIIDHHRTRRRPYYPT